jgi:hypothetical protein
VRGIGISKYSFHRPTIGGDDKVVPVLKIDVKSFQNNDQEKSDITLWSGQVAHAFSNEIPVISDHGVAVPLSLNTRGLSL